MKIKTLTFAFVCAFFCCAISLHARAQATLVQNGKSVFAIVVPADAPTSVQNAAQELQKCIELSSGAKLPLQKDSAAGSTPIISLGSTLQAKAAGFSDEKMADESFRIVTKDGNLFILGPDTPDRGWTKGGSVSNGTAHGVYTFLEDYLNVRWLMPGDLGRDVPAGSTLALPKIDRTVTPAFKWRHLTHLWDHATDPQMRSILQWMDRQKLGGSLAMDYDHNLWRAINESPWNSDVDTPAVKELYAAHPEWFAMSADGTRPYPKNLYAKMETTNPEFVRWFAEKAVHAFQTSPRPRTFSLSPSDGRGWSQSPESKALFDPSATTLYDPEAPPGLPGTSSLVLKWYHDVAQIVAQQYPEGRLTGYIYGDYLYPPTKYAMKLPDNFMPVIAAVGSSYSLYRKEYRDRFSSVLDSWAKVAPENWFYYGWPSQLLRQDTDEIGDANFPGSTGIITPAAPEILDTVFSTLQRDKIKGAYIYGVPSWSNAALANYVIAKMEWDPSLKAIEVQRDWLRHAYGPQAGGAMEIFYRKLDGWLGDYYRKTDVVGSEVNIAMLKGAFAAHYPDLEKLFMQAKAKPMTDVQKQRLQLIEENLIVLQWRLRNSGFLPANFVSPLQRNDVQINELVTKENPGFPLFPGADGAPYVNWTPPQPLPWKVQLAGEAPLASSGAVSGLADSQTLLVAASDGEIRITVETVTQGAYFASFEIKGQAGKLVTSGILNTATPIAFQVQAGSAYTLTIPSRKAVNYRLRIENASLATGAVKDNTLTLSGQPAPVRVFTVPQSTPVGAFEEDGAVILKKPYSGAAAQAVMGDAYINTRVLHSFDDGWKFAPDPQGDGVQRGVLQADFDDSSWKSISPLDWWQMQGFPDYHGAAWYRIKFDAKPLPKGDRARIYFGAVDGNTVVYLNGKKVAEHILGPNFERWDQPFSYDVMEQLKAGENTLVVQVTSKSNDTASGVFKGVALVAGSRR